MLSHSGPQYQFFAMMAIHSNYPLSPDNLVLSQITFPHGQIQFFQSH